LQVNWTSGSNTALFQTSAVGQDVGLQIQSTATNGGNWAITTSDATRGSLTNSLAFQNKGTSTAPMLIDSSGNLLVGTTDSNLNSGTGIKLNANQTTGVVVNSATGNSSHIHLFNTNATNNGYRFYVVSNGGVYNYSGNNSNLSDERTKTNIDLSGNYLAKICAIPVKLFNYKNESEGEQRTLGVIAQDVETVAPELVNLEGFGETPEDGVPLKSIYTTDMMFALMRCIQELKAELDATKAEVAALKGA
jgi:hypothetical protein